jgi:Heterokaryon incompatibility protein (HET)
MENVVRFQYEPLSKDNNRRSIRLLQLLPSSTSEPIKCRIVNVDLYDNPDYEALSYCWGDAANPIRIYSGNEYIEVTRNLHDALVHLRDVENPRTLWIDAICINQRDSQERSQQVGIMRQIYKQSRKTLV